MAAPKGNKNALGNVDSGRPEKYTPEWLQKEAIEFKKWIDQDKNFHLKSFAFERGYSPQRLSEFAKSSIVFSEAYEYAKHKQTERFLINALKRTWDPTFTRYAMARLCGDEWKNSWDREEEKVEKLPVVYSIDFSNCSITPQGIQFNPAESKDVCQNSKTSQDKSSTAG